MRNFTVRALVALCLVACLGACSCSFQLDSSPSPTASAASSSSSSPGPTPTDPTGPGPGAGGSSWGSSAGSGAPAGCAPLVEVAPVGPDGGPLPVIVGWTCPPLQLHPHGPGCLLHRPRVH